MNPDRWSQIEALFHELLELRVSQRAARLEEVPADLAEEVRRLVFAADTTGSTFGSLREAAEMMIDGVQLEPGHELGDFEVVSPLGRGGMGIVYLATQEQPKRHVALKVMSSGLGSTGSERRFEVEADLLARLHHPAIAHVYAAGVLHEGDQRLPWFAMELVEDGKPLTDAARSCTLAEALDLFAQCCDGISHAHERGIIHRDLKPSNMLVDSEGHPRIIDFGIALGHGSTSQGGRSAGTPAYMSPEQARGDEVDTRCDIYALGVVLSELVSRPDRTLRAIIDKAGHPDRAERYTSAADLAADVRSYVEGRPVAAVGTGISYVLGCWIRRNQALTAVAGVTVLAALGGAAGWLEAKEKSADAGESLVVLMAMLDQADPYSSQGPRTSMFNVIEDASEFLNNGASLRPVVEAAYRHRVGDILTNLGRFEEAEGHLARALELHLDLSGEDSLETFEARHDYLSCLISREKFDELYPRLEVHAAIAARVFGEDSAEAYRAAVLRGRALNSEGRWEEGNEFNWALYQRGLETLPPDNPVPYSVLYNYAAGLREFDRRKEAVEYCEQILAWRSEHLGPDSLRTVNTISGLCSFLTELGDAKSMDRAAELFERAYEVYNRVLIEDNAASTTLKNNYATFLRSTGKIDEAIAMHEEILAAREVMYGDHHALTRLTKQNLAVALLDKTVAIERAKRIEGKGIEDEPYGVKLYGERARGILEALVENEHHLCGDPSGPQTHRTNCQRQRLTLGNYLHLAEKYDEAVRVYEDALQLKRPGGTLMAPDGSSTWGAVLSMKIQAWIGAKELEKASSEIATLREIAEAQGGERGALIISAAYCESLLESAYVTRWIDAGELDKAEAGIEGLRDWVDKLPPPQAHALTKKLEEHEENLEAARAAEEDR